jgi:hypothetical protein
VSLLHLRTPTEGNDQVTKDTLNMTDRITCFLCTMYHRKGITISKAQEILGEGADADHLIGYMLGKKQVMKSIGVTPEKYEFTGDGLMEFYRYMMEQAKGEGRTFGMEDEEKLYAYVLRESRKQAA